MKSKYSVTLLAAAVAMLVTSMPVLASKTDDRIESSAKKSYVFKTTSRVMTLKSNQRMASSP
jgi:hyperosmotically inducible periplasmic protein